MKSIDDEAHVWLTDLLMPMMRYRVASLGLEESGAYRFYRRRIQSGRAFKDFELRLVETIVDRVPSVEVIHEIGCGWGQLVFLLAWNGYAVTGFEVDNNRFSSADCFRRALTVVDETRGKRVTILNEFFPPVHRPDPNRSLVISTNIVISNSEFVENQMLWGMRHYRYAIVDIDHFGRERDAHERQSLIAGAEQAGLRDLGVILDAGIDGQFHLFEPAVAGMDQEG